MSVMAIYHQLARERLCGRIAGCTCTTLQLRTGHLLRFFSNSEILRSEPRSLP